MDKVDLEILGELAKNAQTSFSKIAKKLRLSPKTVLARYERMRKEGIVLRSSVIVDLSRLGYQGRVFMNITNAPNRDRIETIEALKRVKNIFLIAEIMGDSDVLAIGAVKGLKDVINLIKAVRRLTSVDQVDFTLAENALFPLDKGYERLFETIRETSNLDQGAKTH